MSKPAEGWDCGEVSGPILPPKALLPFSELVPKVHCTWDVIMSKKRKVCAANTLGCLTDWMHMCHDFKFQKWKKFPCRMTPFLGIKAKSSFNFEIRCWAIGDIPFLVAAQTCHSGDLLPFTVNNTRLSHVQYKAASYNHHWPPHTHFFVPGQERGRKQINIEVTHTHTHTPLGQDSGCHQH